MSDSNQSRAKELVDEWYHRWVNNQTNYDGLIDLVAQALSSPAPVWSSDKPTVTGKYWWRQWPLDTPEILTVGYGFGNWPGHLRVEILADMSGQWSGPLEVPK